MLEKILSIVSIGSLLSSLSLTRRFVVSFIIIVALTVIAAIIGAAMIVFALYIGDAALIRHGTDPDIAALITFAIGLVALLIVVVCIACKVKHLQKIPLCSMGISTTGSSALAMLHGFYRGIMGNRPS